MIFNSLIEFVHITDYQQENQEQNIKRGHKGEWVSRTIAIMQVAAQLRK